LAGKQAAEQLVKINLGNQRVLLWVRLCIISVRLYEARSQLMKRRINAHATCGVLLASATEGSHGLRQATWLAAVSRTTLWVDVQLCLLPVFCRNTETLFQMACKKIVQENQPENQSLTVTFISVQHTIIHCFIYFAGTFTAKSPSQMTMWSLVECSRRRQSSASLICGLSTMWIIIQAFDWQCNSPFIHC